MRKIFAAALLATSCFAGAAMAQGMSGMDMHHDMNQAGITVEHAWARATAPSQHVGGVFLTLTDHGAADQLVGAASPISETVELHETVSDNGVMKMRPVPVLALDTGKSLELKPGSYHLMVMGLKQQLKQGDTFPVTLTFAHAAPITVTVTVEAAGAMGGMNMEHGSMGGMAMPKQ
jgi:copper(I)-binding protein